VTKPKPSGPKVGGKYVVEYDCLNCRSHFGVEYSRGTEASNIGECPECGCAQGIRRVKVSELPRWVYTTSGTTNFIAPLEANP